MAISHELAVQQKKELETKEEKTVPARYYVPSTDIYETPEALTLVMEMPGVDKKDLAVTLEDDVLQVDGRIDFGSTTSSSRSTSNTMSVTTRARSPSAAESIATKSAHN